jgi:hypothetical protein
LPALVLLSSVEQVKQLYFNHCLHYVHRVTTVKLSKEEDRIFYWLFQIGEEDRALLLQVVSQL